MGQGEKRGVRCVHEGIRECRRGEDHEGTSIWGVICTIHRYDKTMVVLTDLEGMEELGVLEECSYVSI